MKRRRWGPIRTLLFAPGNDLRKLRRLGDFGADAVVMDLEDAVADDEKVAARDVARRHLHGLRCAGRPTLVRVNGADTRLLFDDVRSVLADGLGGIVVPKVEDVQVLWEIDRILARWELECGLPADTIRLVVLVETALGMARCEEILSRAPERLERVVFGSGDYRAELGLGASAGEGELAYPRGRLVAASIAVGLGAPVDGPFINIEDDEGLRASCAISKSFGFEGRVVVHPGQVKSVAQVFGGYTAEEIEHLRRVVEAFEAAEASGSAAIKVDGVFVDYPIYRQAREVLGGL